MNYQDDYQKTLELRSEGMTKFVSEQLTELLKALNKISRIPLGALLITKRHIFSIIVYN